MDGKVSAGGCEGSSMQLTEQNSAWALQQLRMQMGLGKYAVARPGLLGRPAAVADNILQLMSENMVLVNVKKGDQLTSKGDVITEFILVASGTCHVESCGEVKKLDTLPLLLDLDTFIFGLDVHAQSVFAATPCQLYVLSRDRLLAARGGTPPSDFPPASYHTIALVSNPDSLKPLKQKRTEKTSASAARLTKAVAAASIGESTNGTAVHYTWRLHHPQQLFAAPMDRCTLASEWFALPTTPSTKWRLLLIPHNFDTAERREQAASPSRRYTLCIGCTGYQGLRSGQLANGSFQLQCSLATTGNRTRSF